MPTANLFTRSKVTEMQEDMETCGVPDSQNGLIHVSVVVRNIIALIVNFITIGLVQQEKGKTALLPRDRVINVVAEVNNSLTEPIYTVIVC